MSSEIFVDKREKKVTKRKNQSYVVYSVIILFFLNSR